MKHRTMIVAISLMATFYSHNIILSMENNIIAWEQEHQQVLQKEDQMMSDLLFHLHDLQKQHEQEIQKENEIINKSIQEFQQQAQVKEKKRQEKLNAMHNVQKIDQLMKKYNL